MEIFIVQKYNNHLMLFFLLSNLKYLIPLLSSFHNISPLTFFHELDPQLFQMYNFSPLDI